MITYVDNSNHGVYRTRFEQATMVLRENGNITSDSEITTLEEYFLYLKDLALLDPYYTMMPVDEDTFDIDADTRKIAVPADFAKNGIGVQGDEIAEVIYFTIDRFFDATDLSDPSMQIAIQWENAAGVAGVSKEFVRDITSRPGKLIFGWPLVSEITNTPGKVKFSVRFYKIGERETIADNGATILQQYLTYNFNTIPSEVTINASLDYSLYGKEKIESLDKESLIVNRIVNSTLTDPAIPEPEMPVWKINLEDMATIEAIYAEVDAMPEGTAKDEAQAAADIKVRGMLIKDLTEVGREINKETGAVTVVYGYPMEVYATGNGAVSYNWLHADIDAKGTISSEDVGVTDVNNFAYVPAAAGEVDLDKVYYTATWNWEKQERENPETGEVEWVDVQTTIARYNPQPVTEGLVLDNNGCMDDNGNKVQLYEKHSAALATSTGVYHVVAVNRRLGKTKTIDSYKIIIPMPQIPEIQPEENVTTMTKNDVEYPMIKEEDDIIHVLLDADGRATLHTTAVSPEIAEAEANEWEFNPDNVSLSYQWYTNASLLDGEHEDTNIYEEDEEAGGNIGDEYKINGSIEASHELEIADPDHYDVLYYAKVTNNRNLATAFKYSKPYRVTPMPELPILLAPVANETNIRNYSIGTTIDLSLDTTIQSDEYTYQWRKVVIEDYEITNEGVLIQYEDDDVKYVPVKDDTMTEPFIEEKADGQSSQFKPVVPGYYYCEITNHLNGSTSMIRTPFYNFQNPNG